MPGSIGRADQQAQKTRGQGTAVQATLAARPDTGRAAHLAVTAVDQFQRACDELVGPIEETG